MAPAALCLALALLLGLPRGNPAAAEPAWLPRSNPAAPPPTELLTGSSTDVTTRSAAIITVTRAIASPAAGQTALQLRRVFEPGEANVHGFNVACFRIPGFIVANTTLVVFAEARNYGGGDAGSHDLVAKRSTNWGQTWLPLQMVLEPGLAWGTGEGGPKGGTAGDPTPVYDQQTGTIFVVFEYNPARFQARGAKGQPSNLTYAFELWLLSSADDGVTWSAPRNISGIQPHRQPGEPEWCTKAGAGGGHGIQLRHGPHKGRLIIPGYHGYCDQILPFTPPSPPPELCSWLVFDFGRPVRLDGFRVYPHGDGVHDISSHYMEAAGEAGATEQNSHSGAKWRKLGPTFGGDNYSAVPQEYSFPVTSSRAWRWVITATFPSAAAAASCGWTGTGGCQPNVAEIEFHEPAAVAAPDAGVYLRNNGTASWSLLTSSSGGETKENEPWMAVDGKLLYNDYAAGWDAGMLAGPPATAKAHADQSGHSDHSDHSAPPAPSPYAEPNTCHSHVLISDSHGVSWRYGSTPSFMPGSVEGSLTEVGPAAPGELLYVARLVRVTNCTAPVTPDRRPGGGPTTGTVHCAGTMRSTDSGETFHNEHDTGQLPDPSCKNTVASYEPPLVPRRSEPLRNNTLVHGGAHNWQYNGRVNVSVLFRCGFRTSDDSHELLSTD